MGRHVAVAGGCQSVSVKYLSVVQLGPAYAGLAASATVAAQSTAGSQPAAVAGATAGAVWESANQPGLYGCLLTYPSALASGVLPWAAWSFGSSAPAIDDHAPAPVAGATVDLTGKLGTPRDITSVASSAITVNDALWGAVVGTGGRQQWTPTTAAFSTPSGDQVYRSFTIATHPATANRS